MVYRTFPKTRKEYEELRDLTKRTGAEFIGGNKRVHVSTAKGTDLTLEITDKLLQSVCSAEWIPDGNCITAAAMIIGSLLSKPDDPEKVEEFFFFQKTKN